MPATNAIQDHYGLFARSNAILTSVAATGADINHLQPADLAPFDQLHTAGHTATSALITLLSPEPHHHVLDVGCGIGGPARLLAHAKQCTVTGIDLTPDFIATAKDFTTRTKQSDRVTFHVGSATALPFAPSSFDAAWHIHMSMNVEDKAGMYREIFRVLKPGARFALYDPIRGERDAPIYPVPWAATPDTSFLLRQVEMTDVIESAGFQPLEVRDATADGLAWFTALAQARAAATAPAQTQQDPRFLVMSKNHRSNLESGAVAIMCGLFLRP